MILNKLSLVTNNNHTTNVIIGSNCILESLQSHSLSSKRVFIITHESLLTTLPIDINDILKNACNSDCYFIFVPDGEAAKSIDSYSYCLNQIFDIGVERGDTIIGLGGGVVTDLAGFVASTCLRGIKLINIPTTLLAQVDAAIGGKTGINHVTGKNLIGSFYQPDLIINDCATLRSLPKHEAHSGFAEIIKYGVITDKPLFDVLNSQAEVLKLYDFEHNETLWLDIISQSIKNKIAVVEQDEKESSLRAILNFGHTIGHGIEALFDYNTYKHGFCVAFGMCAATYIAKRKNFITGDGAESIYQILRLYDYQHILLKPIKTTALLHHMGRDKKVKDSKIRFILPTDIGKVILSQDVTEDDILSSVAFIQTFFRGDTP
tara:strand:+ start:157 stop:1284 length:1128 start_codon:yes stop_codon:yes gene_type:complete